MQEHLLHSCIISIFLGGGDLTLVFLSWNVTLVLLKAREYKNTSCCFERLSWFYFQQNVKALLCVHFFWQILFLQFCNCETVLFNVHGKFCDCSLFSLLLSDWDKPKGYSRRAAPCAGAPSQEICFWKVWRLPETDKEYWLPRWLGNQQRYGSINTPLRCQCHCKAFNSIYLVYICVSVILGSWTAHSAFKSWSR